MAKNSAIDNLNSYINIGVCVGVSPQRAATPKKNPRHRKLKKAKAKAYA